MDNMKQQHEREPRDRNAQSRATEDACEHRPQRQEDARWDERHAALEASQRTMPELSFEYRSQYHTGKRGGVSAKSAFALVSGP